MIYVLNALKRLASKYYPDSPDDGVFQGITQNCIDSLTVFMKAFYDDNLHVSRLSDLINRYMLSERPELEDKSIFSIILESKEDNIVYKYRQFVLKHPIIIALHNPKDWNSDWMLYPKDDDDISYPVLFISQIIDCSDKTLHELYYAYIMYNFLRAMSIFGHDISGKDFNKSVVIMERVVKKLDKDQIFSDKNEMLGASLEMLSYFTPTIADEIRGLMIDFNQGSAFSIPSKIIEMMKNNYPVLLKEVQHTMKDRSLKDFVDDNIKHIYVMGNKVGIDDDKIDSFTSEEKLSPKYIDSAINLMLGEDIKDSIISMISSKEHNTIINFIITTIERQGLTINANFLNALDKETYNKITERLFKSSESILLEYIKVDDVTDNDMNKEDDTTDNLVDSMKSLNIT